MVLGGGGGGGGWNHIFRTLAVTVDDLGFFACSGHVSDTPHCTSTPITGCTLGVGGLPLKIAHSIWLHPPPLFWGWVIQKIMFQRRLGQWESCTRAKL